MIIDNIHSNTHIPKHVKLGLKFQVQINLIFLFNSNLNEKFFKNKDQSKHTLFEYFDTFEINSSRKFSSQCEVPLLFSMFVSYYQLFSYYQVGNKETIKLGKP